MRRRNVHGGLAVVTLCLTALAIAQWFEINESKSIRQGISRAQTSLPTDDGSPQLIQSFRYPEARLAWANALSETGNFEAAESVFSELIRKHNFDATGQAARFNLANAYLRQGMRSELPASQARPMLELAKLRYRDLLRHEPGDWDARYNLERALRLAPERAEILAHDKGDPIKSVRVVVPGFSDKDLP